ncbi:MAG TPA: bifunctional phosphoglucose/phosphomannose isomerase [Acidobacteriota bacterium]|nr:bifunctional phosphoglucose/phosphomannose isomerase [Acidobacteriota bacterium]
MTTTDEQVLDDRERIAALDPGGMLDLVGGFGELLDEAVGIARAADLPHITPVRNVAVLGLGGSAIGGDLVTTLVGDQLEVPFKVIRGYELPRFVDGSTLVIASSYSGNTEETLAALRAALETPARIVCLTSGGEMEEIASERGLPSVKLKAGQPPRSALPFSFAALLRVLSAAQLLPEMMDALEASVDWIKHLSRIFGPDTQTPDNLAKKLALKIVNKLPGIYGSDDRLEFMARRWAAQFSENGKQLAYSKALPEMNHNEIVGWKHPSRVVGELIPVFLRDGGDHPRTQLRFEITRDLMAGTVDQVLEYWSMGESWMERFWSLVLLGDFASVYLAVLNQEDPTQIDMIEALKNRLSQHQEPSENDEPREKR